MLTAALRKGSGLSEWNNVNVAHATEMIHELRVLRALTVPRGERVPIPSDNAQILGNWNRRYWLSWRELSKGERKVSYPLG